MQAAKVELAPLLDFLCTVIKSDRVAQVESLHQRALRYEPVERLPIIFSYPLPLDFRFPALPSRFIYRAPNAMLYNELVSAWDTSIAARGLIDDDLPITIRPNWGTVLTASVLGGVPEQTEDNTPWIRRDDERPITLDAIIDAGLDRDDMLAGHGWIPRVLETYQYYHDVLAGYPELRRKVRITLPDLQGPLDTVEMLRGDQLFVELMLDPDKSAAALLVAAKVQVQLTRLFAKYTTDSGDGFSCQHGFPLPGGILVRNDSAVMISPELYRNTVFPADDYVLRECAGGGIHSCGRFQHVVPVMMEIPSLRCIDFGQSGLNDTQAIYENAREKRVCLTRIHPEQRALRTAEVLRTFPTGVSLHYHAESLQEARMLFDDYRRAAESLDRRENA
jgi:hypothetical protein